MKLVCFRRGDALQPGVLVDGQVADLSAAGTSLLEIIANAHERSWLDRALDKAPRLPIGSAQLVAPIPCPDATSSVLARTTPRTHASFSNPASMQRRQGRTCRRRRWSSPRRLRR